MEDPLRIGRHAARVVRCAVLAETLDAQWTLLIENIAKGDFATFNRPTFPKGEIRGFRQGKWRLGLRQRARRVH